MARNLNTPVYSGKLVLDKITGIRADRLKGATPIQDLIKPDTSFKAAPRSMKTVANVTRDGLKK
jgi:hypothetical protein